MPIHWQHVLQRAKRQVDYLRPDGSIILFFVQRSNLFAWLVQEFLYRDVLRKTLSLGQTLELVRFYKALRLKEPKALKIFTTVYHLSHS